MSTDAPIHTDTEPYSHLAHANDLEPSIGHHRLLDGCPVHREDHDPPFYVVSRYADVMSVALDPELWQNRDGPGIYYQPEGVLGSTDDPAHRRQRKVLQDAFRPSAIAALAPRIERIATELWDRAFALDGEGDFVELFAFPFPAIAIAELLGVPTDCHEEFGEWSNDIVAGLGGGDLARVDEANRRIFELVDELVDARRAHLVPGVAPPEDVVGVLTVAEMDGVLSHQEVRRLCQQLLVAGHETTASLIGLMLYRLIEQPALAARVRAEPGLVHSAVEEFLRFDSPVQGLFRTNSRECELGGVPIPERTKLHVLYAAANRDPRVWERPDDLVLDRHPPGARPHLAFGWGVHHCIGAALARHEAVAALRLMVDRFERVELVGPVAVNAPFILRGLATMPIRWVASAGSLG